MRDVKKIKQNDSVSGSSFSFFGFAVFTQQNKTSNLLNNPENHKTFLKLEPEPKQKQEWTQNQNQNKTRPTNSEPEPKRQI